MTDIFARKPAPLPRNRAPAKSYDTFITVFERHVAHVQQLVEAARKLEQPYIAVCDVLRSRELPQDHKLLINSSHVSLHITALPTDEASFYLALRDDISKALGAEPSYLHGGGSCTLYWSWTYGRVVLFVTIPEAGIGGLQVSKIERVSRDFEYRFEFHNVFGDAVDPEARDVEEVLF